MSTNYFFLGIDPPPPPNRIEEVLDEVLTVSEACHCVLRTLFRFGCLNACSYSVPSHEANYRLHLELRAIDPIVPKHFSATQAQELVAYLATLTIETQKHRKSQCHSDSISLGICL
jgi:hypothetical protein